VTIMRREFCFERCWLFLEFWNSVGYSQKFDKDCG